MSQHADRIRQWISVTSDRQNPFGSFIHTSLYIICATFRKSGFVLRRKFVEMFTSAYLKISTASNILDCLRQLQGFIAEALLAVLPEVQKPLSTGDPYSIQPYCKAVPVPV